MRNDLQNPFSRVRGLIFKKGRRRGRGEEGGEKKTKCTSRETTLRQLNELRDARLSRTVVVYADTASPFLFLPPRSQWRINERAITMFVLMKVARRFKFKERTPAVRYFFSSANLKKRGRK